MNKQEKISVLESALIEKLGTEFTAPRATIQAIADENGVGVPLWIYADKSLRVGRGMYRLNLQSNVVPMKPKSAAPVAAKQNMNMESESFQENLIPATDPLFTPFGNYNLVKDVVKSKMFYPLYITGLSGNGKTLSVEQACASTKREVIRINFTVETDEDDLIGGFRLVDGETKFFKGPVIKAMELGAVLLCDEIDLANPAKVMCLQSILEGKPLFIKKTGQLVYPTDGFNVIATANTKGRGSDDGKFIGTNVLNEAFLERFAVTFEQQYPKDRWIVDMSLNVPRWHQLQIQSPCLQLPTSQ